jgi:CheY-like chemotaxis protein
MYGMIHRALRELVIEQRGSATWEVIVVDAGVEPLHMISAVEHRRDIGTILDSTQKCVELATALMTVADQKVDSPLPLVLDETLGSCEALFTSICTDGITFRTRLAAGHAEVHIARNGVVSAIGNLIINACQAMAGSGEITLTTSLDCADKEAQSLRARGAGVVVIAVADNGPGMSNAVQQRVFEKFYTTNKASRGLGLTFVYAFIHQMGGRIRINSVEGEGTEIRLYLPIDQSNHDRSAAALVVQRRRVLLVDDEQAAVEALAELLEGIGYAVQTATCAEEAIASATKTPPDILLTDVIMKGTDGIALARWAERELPDLAIILMSGYVPDQRNIGAGWKFIRKPIDTDLLTGLLEAVL